jgi:precorrin-3B synthase
VRVTPWRAFAFSCASTTQAAAVLADAASIGLLTNRQDPVLGVIACIGAAGCWQTQLDTLAEAERFVANRPADLEPGALVHVSGCDKFCVTRATVTLTLLGRTDQTGFDALGPHAE